MNVATQPIHLFADSQLLFWKDARGLYLGILRELIDKPAPKAAYVGASNGDDPVYYSIFEAAMEAIDISDRRMILSSFGPEDKAFVADADIVLLAGGDAEKGQSAIDDNGLAELLIKKYQDGALLIGISAGAVQLGLFGIVEMEQSFNRLFDTLKLAPFVISAHDEKEDWRSLKEVIQLLNGSAVGIGISTGGGMVYYPDGSLEALRHPLHNFTVNNGVIAESLVFPSRDG